jgi:hypothetical protein
MINGFSTKKIQYFFNAIIVLKLDPVIDPVDPPDHGSDGLTRVNSGQPKKTYKKQYGGNSHVLTFSSHFFLSLLSIWGFLFLHCKKTIVMALILAKSTQTPFL